jgi:hypothetical protein
LLQVAGGGKVPHEARQQPHKIAESEEVSAAVLQQPERPSAALRSTCGGQAAHTVLVRCRFLRPCARTVPLPLPPPRPGAHRHNPHTSYCSRTYSMAPLLIPRPPPPTHTLSHSYSMAAPSFDPSPLPYTHTYSQVSQVLQLGPVGWYATLQAILDGTLRIPQQLVCHTEVTSDG